jgi:hypothetical protein
MSARSRIARAIGLFFVAFAAWASLFWWKLPAVPHFRAQTTATNGKTPGPFGPSISASLTSISSDGRRVIIQIHHLEGASIHFTTEYQIWDAKLAHDVTPPLWRDKNWHHLAHGPRSLSGWPWRLRDVIGGSGITSNDPMWHGIVDKVKGLERKAAADLVQAGFANDEEAATRLIRMDASLSADGRFLAHSGPGPLHHNVVIDDVVSGKQIAVLPGVSEGVLISPDGRTAVSVHPWTDEATKDPGIILWDISTSARRLRLPLPEISLPCHVWFTANGRFIFAKFSPTIPHKDGASSDPPRCRWWDANTGQQLGDMLDPHELVLADGYSKLVTHSRRTDNSGIRDDHILEILDYPSGKPAERWSIPGITPGKGYIYDLVGAEDSPYLAACFNPDEQRRPPAKIPWPWLERQRRALFPQGPDDLPPEVILLNLGDRRLAGRLPGRSASISANGKWLATIDDAGVVRVWQLPMQTPWPLITILAANAAALSCLLLVGLSWAISSWKGRRQMASPAFVEKQRES